MLSHVVNREEEERRSHNESYSLDYHIVKTKSESQGKREPHHTISEVLEAKEIVICNPQIRNPSIHRRGFIEGAKENLFATKKKSNFLL